MPDPPTTYPLDPASVSGTTITADILVNNPTRINRFMTDYLNINRRRFLLNVVFDNGGGMSAGQSFEPHLLRRLLDIRPQHAPNIDARGGGIGGHPGALVHIAASRT